MAWQRKYWAITRGRKILSTMNGQPCLYETKAAARLALNGDAGEKIIRVTALMRRIDKEAA